MKTKSVKLTHALVEDAERYAEVFDRSTAKQVEHWAKVGKMAEENPDLSYTDIKDVLLGKLEIMGLKQNGILPKDVH